MSTLLERLEAQGPELARRAIEEMYENPFWQDRFGSRGREMADQDGQLHLTYLMQALTSSDPSVLTGYARWLQTLLVSRGMCSRHLAENFERLERGIAEHVEEPQPAVSVLRAARQALLYEQGPARELQLLSDPLAAAAVGVLEEENPTWFSGACSFPSLASYTSITEAERAHFHREMLDHLSYLADALHTTRPELFSAHVLWTHDFMERHQSSAERAGAMVRALLQGVAARSPELLAAIRPVVEHALARLEEHRGKHAPARAAGEGTAP